MCAFLRLLLAIGLLSAATLVSGNEPEKQPKLKRSLLPFGSCGVPKGTDAGASSTKGRQHAVEKQWPWTVLVRGKDIHCGGALISNQWILTAAHCNDSHYTIGMGFKDENSAYRVERPASFSYRHLGYIHEMPYDFDIMMIKLDMPVEFTEHIQPICLPEQNAPNSLWDYCYVSGWGTSLKNYGELSNKLTYKKVEVVQRRHCERKLDTRLYNSQMCGIPAAKDDPEAGTCLGDSGAPLSCRFRGIWFLAGIVSFVPIRVGKDIELTCFIYSKLAYFRDWVEYVMKTY